MAEINRLEAEFVDAAVEFQQAMSEVMCVGILGKLRGADVSMKGILTY